MNNSALNNIVTINGKNVRIENPTAHCPNAIIGRYVDAELINPNVASEIQRVMSCGLSEGEAAQDLFARAVQYEERGQYTLLTRNLCMVVCITTMIADVPMSTIPGQFIYIFCVFYFLGNIMFFLLRLGNTFISFI